MYGVKCSLARNLVLSGGCVAFPLLILHPETKRKLHCPSAFRPSSYLRTFTLDKIASDTDIAQMNVNHIYDCLLILNVAAQFSVSGFWIFLLAI